MNYSLFEKYPELFAFSTERDGGVSVGKYASLNLCDYTGDSLSSVKRNRQIFCEENLASLNNALESAEPEKQEVLKSKNTTICGVCFSFFSILNSSQRGYIGL